MTLPAVLTKLVLVRILMTACAVVVLQPPELLEFFTISCCHFMALLTIHGLVFACKSELCIIVRKPGGRCKRGFSMAQGAI